MEDEKPKKKSRAGRKPNPRSSVDKELKANGNSTAGKTGRKPTRSRVKLASESDEIRNGQGNGEAMVWPAGEQPLRRQNSLERTLAYADAVLAGDIVAGPHVRNECRRFRDDLANGRKRGIYFDVDRADRVFDFFEKMLKLTEGQFEGRPLILAPPQAFIIGNLFGWHQVPKGSDGEWNFDAPFRPAANSDDFSNVKRRRFRRAYIEMGKGQGKSPLAGGIGLYGLIADGEGGSQVYAAASKKDQANILFHDACKMVRRSPALAKRLVLSGGVGKEHNVAHLRSSSFFRAISKEAGKTGSGPRPLFALCDEVHEHPDRSIMEMLERGFKFRLSPLLFMITNSGTDKQSICWEEHEHACKVAAGTMSPDEDFTYVGEPIDDSTFTYVCALDRKDDPLNDPSCWIKANPMLGIILSEDYLAGVVKQARDMPGKRNGILRLHFCVWTESVDGWMKQELIQSAMAEFDPYEVHRDAVVASGIDLSAARDLTAGGFVVETGTKTVERVSEDGTIEYQDLPTFDAWVECWSPIESIKAKPDSERDRLMLWSTTMHAGTEQPYLRALAGERIRHDYLAAHWAKCADIFKIMGVAYDRYAYDKFKEECDNRGLVLKHIAHPQGGKVRAKVNQEDIDAAKANNQEVPLGLWMPGSIKLFEDAILDGRVRLRASPVLMAALMGATMAPPDDMGNTWFVKAKATVRIDPAIALVMAFGLIHQKPIDKKPRQFQMLII